MLKAKVEEKGGGRLRRCRFGRLARQFMEQ